MDDELRNLSLQYNVINKKYSSIKERLKSGNDVDIKESLTELHDLMKQNVGRQHFYAKDFIKILIKLSIHQTTVNETIIVCAKVLELCLSDTQDNSNKLIQQLTTCLHKPTYSQNILFYFLISEIVDNADSALEFLKSNLLEMLIKLYQSKFADVNINSELTEAMPFQQFLQPEDKEESEKSNASQTSSLSIEDDVRVNYYEENEVMSNRSLLSGLGNEIFEDEEETENKEYNNDINDMPFEDDISIASPKSYELKDQFQKYKMTAINNIATRIDSLDLKEEQIAVEAPVNNEDETEIKNVQDFRGEYYFPRETTAGERSNSRELEVKYEKVHTIKIKVNDTSKRLAENGPLFFEPPEKQHKTQIVEELAKLDLSEIKDEYRCNEFSNFTNRLIIEENEKSISPMARIKKFGENVVDTKFESAIEMINENRQGEMLLEEIGKQVGEFIAMSDYPIVNKMTSIEVMISHRTSEESETRIMNFELADDFKTEENKLNSNFNSEFTVINQSIEKTFLNMEEKIEKIKLIEEESNNSDICEKFGILSIINNLLLNVPESSNIDFEELYYILIYDLMYLRREKHGFFLLLVEAILGIIYLLQEVSIAGKSDDWNIVLEQMFEFVTWELKFKDIKTNEIVEEDDLIKQIVEKKFIYLPSLIFLMPRLEGYRRNLVPSITLLCDKLKNLCIFHDQLSAVEDMPVVLGVLVDLIQASKYSCFIRASVVEEGMPAILKILQLILSKKIKSREYYVFISHRLLELFSALIEISPNKLCDMEQTNINQIFINIFILQAIVVNPWIKRYAYLILMNSRIKMELSGLFINQIECENAFHEIKLTFLKFTSNIALLTTEHVFESNYNVSEDSFQIDLLKEEIIIPERANLGEEKEPLGDDQEFNLQTNLNELPLHILLMNELNNSTLYKLKNEEIFLKENGEISNKKCINQLEVDFSDMDFLVDYNIGVLMEYLMLEECNIISSNLNRDTYVECLIALKNIISLPNMFNSVEEEQVNEYIMFHYLSFLKFYKQSSFKYIINDEEIAKHHLDLLLEITKIDNEYREQLYVIKIIDFLVEEILIFDGIYDSQIKISPSIEINIKHYDPCKIIESTSVQYDFNEIVDIVENHAVCDAYNDKMSYNESSGEVDQKVNENSSLSMNFDEEKSIMSKFFKSSDVNLTIKCLETPPEVLDSNENIGNKAKIPPSEFELELKNISVNKQQKKESARELKIKEEESIKSNFDFAEDIQVIYDDGSESDGWGDTAERLGLDLGEEIKPEKQSTTEVEKNMKLEPKFQLNLNTIVADKIGIKEISERVTQSENLKMHLLMAQNVIQNNSSENIFDEMTPMEQDAKPKDHIKIDKELHLSILMMIINLIINPVSEVFDQEYVTEFPSNSGMTNIPVILHKHLNNKFNKEVVKLLLEEKLEDYQERLLRLLCLNQFNSEFYKLDKFKLIAKGAFGEVYVGNVNLTEETKFDKYATPVAIKLQALNMNEKDRCVLHDLYNEITIMEKLQQNEQFCELYDYGVTLEGYVIVMQEYHSSFRRFRLNEFCEPKNVYYSNEERRLKPYGHEQSLVRYVRIYLLSYLAFLKAIKHMHELNVIHFDLKSDNIFITPSSIKWLCTENNYQTNHTAYENELLDWYLDTTRTEDLPYILTIGDFGESHVFTSEMDMHTLLSKGTEFNKSPEMLIATNQQFRANFRRSSQEGASVESDVWSAACTLYEMLTGDFLFYDSDWIRFFLRATTIPAREKYAYECPTFQDAKSLFECVRGIELVPEKRAMLGNCKPLIDLLEYQLVEDPVKRPNIDECIIMTEHVLNKYFPPNKFDNTNMFDFIIEGSLQECVANIDDILTPIDVEQIDMNGPSLQSVKKIIIDHPIDVLENGTIYIGKTADINDSIFLNKSNIETIVDCTILSRPPRWVFVNRVFRPSARLVAIFGSKEYKNSETEFKSLLIELEEVFDVIRCTLAENGCVLFVDDERCLGANLILACLMEFESFYLYPAVIYLKRIKPDIELNTKFLELLEIWHDLRTKIGLKLITEHPDCCINEYINLNDPIYYNFITTRVALANYKCVCGRIFFVVKPDAAIEYCLCNCVISNDEEKTRNKQSGKIESCPSTSCKTILNYYNSLFGVELHKILYAYVNYSDVISNFERATDYTSNVCSFKQCEKEQLEFKTVDDIRMPLFRIAIKDDWRLSYCTMCGAPTHYYRIHKQVKQLCIIAIFSNK